MHVKSKIMSKSNLGDNSVDKSANFNTLPNHDRSYDGIPTYNNNYNYNSYVNRSNIINQKQAHNSSNLQNQQNNQNQLNQSGSKRNLSQNVNIINLQDLMQNRVLSPKTHYRFKNNYTNTTTNKSQNKTPTSKTKYKSRSRTPKNISSNKSPNKANKTINFSTKKSPSVEKRDKVKYNNRLLNKSRDKDHNNSKGSIGGYLDMRHSETIEKINKLKYEKLLEETKELRFHPKLSKNSKIIIDKLVDTKANVFDRLAHGRYHSRKKSEEKMKLEEINQQNTKPAINKTSQKMQRTIDDLYYWQKCLDDKLEIHKNNVS